MARNLIKQAEDDAREFRISVSDALTLEFLTWSVLADMHDKLNAAAFFHVAAQHAAGKMDAATMRQCWSALDRSAA